MKHHKYDSANDISPAILIPAQNAAMGMLKAAIAILCFLTTLTLATLLALNHTVTQWKNNIEGEITVQIKPRQGRDMEQDLEKAHAILNQIAGIKSAHIISFEETEKLLKPWILDENIISALPLSRLIAITIDPDNPPDYAELKQKLDENIPNITLDTHRIWHSRLTDAAEKIALFGYGALTLIFITMTALTIFAMRAVMEGNRNIVNVLHIAGAKDQFISKLFLLRIARLILLSGGVGTSVAILATLLIKTHIDANPALLRIISPINAIGDILPLTLIPVAMMLIGLGVAHISITRILKNEN